MGGLSLLLSLLTPLSNGAFDLAIGPAADALRLARSDVPGNRHPPASRKRVAASAQLVRKLSALRPHRRVARHAVRDRVGRWRQRVSDRKSTRLNSSHLGISHAVF